MNDKYGERFLANPIEGFYAVIGVADDWRFAVRGRKLRRLGPQQPLQLGFCQLEMIEVAVEGPDVAGKRLVETHARRPRRRATRLPAGG